MGIEADHSIGAAAVGLGATLFMDLWNLFLKRGFDIPSLNYCFLGRWLGHMTEGTIRHASIAASTPKPFECTLGRIAHYSIGVVLALVSVLLLSDDWGWLARELQIPGTPG
jgi:hypothetical protein